VARWVKWREDEYELLVELYRGWGDRPPEQALIELSVMLKRRGLEFTPRAAERSYRSVGSIRAQIRRLDLIARGDPRGAEAPSLMREVWQRSQGDFAARSTVLEEPQLEDRAPWKLSPAQEQLVGFLRALDQLMGELAERSADLMEPVNAANFQMAYRDLHEKRVFDRSVERLEQPWIEEELTAFGLTGPPLKLKLEGFYGALQRMAGRWTWKRLKPVLKWANVLLGSLAQTATLGLVDPVRELKESGEAAAEEAYESDPESWS
jgi:hypothetical protein